VGPVTKQSEHLSSAQIENYGIRTSGAGPETAQRDEHQRADQRMADKLSDDQSTADQSMIDQRSNDQRTSDQDTSDQRIEAHLADCASCRNRLLDFHRSLFASPTYQPEPDRTMAEDPKAEDPKNDHTNSALADSKFANLKDPADPQVRTAATPECPSDDALRQLAAGLTPDDTAAPRDALATKLLQHAAICNHCGPLLRTFTEDFSDDFSPEEQAALANLQSASAEWLKNTARQMLEAGGVQVVPAPATDGQPVPRKPSTKAAAERKPFFWKWVLVPAIAAVVAVAAITFPIYLARRDSPEKVEALLAQAYTEQRNLEMRIPYAKHGEFHQKRSGEPTPLLQLPESSRKAADAISSHLKVHPDDPEWLLLSARWYLLDWQFKPALEALEKIENKDPARQSEIDMVRAMALYEKAAYDPNEYGRAIDLLGTVLQKNPNDPIALHNQAVACEKAQNYVCAIDDWNRLLKIEKDPGWSGEAQKHLNELQGKKKPASTPSPK